MSAGYPKRVVLLAFAFGLGIVIETVATTTGGEPEEQLSRQTYDVSRLARGDSDFVVDVITTVIEPRAWESAGGPGAIEVKEKDKFEIVQTAAIHKRLADLLAALGKLPSLQERPAAKTTKQILRIPAGEKTAAGQAVMVYYLDGLIDARNDSINLNGLADAGSDSPSESLIGKILSTVAPKTWEDGGGTGVLTPFPAGRALVVLQSREVHDQLFKLLEKLHRQRMQSGS